MSLCRDGTVAVAEIALDRLEQFLAYSPDTGDLTWRRTKGAAKAGSNAGTLKTDGYIQVCFDGLLLGAHVIAFWLHHRRKPIGEVDHADRNRSNNRIDNLRDASRSQQRANSRSHIDASSRFKGVDRHRGKWRARLYVHGRSVHLGYFATEDSAARAYDVAALAHHGEFALPNILLAVDGADGRAEIRPAQPKGD